MSEQLNKLAAAAEQKTDYLLTKLVNFPYSWIVFVVYTLFLVCVGWVLHG